MSLEKIELESDRAWALWKLNESEETLLSLLPYKEAVPDNLTNAQKRLEWLGGRILTARLMQAMGLVYQGVVKDAFGKPFPKGYPFQLSLSHSYPYVAAIIDRNESVGIDLEQPKEKLLRIAPRVLHPGELQDAGTDIVKHCIYWCAKEALVKIYGKKDLTFAENLLINPFERHEKGDIIGSIIVGVHTRKITLSYLVYPNFIVVFNNRSQP